MRTNNKSTASEATPPPAQKSGGDIVSLVATDKLLTFRQVYELIGSRCRSGHTARALARRGQLVAVRLNERVTRYTLSSVMALIEGRAA